MFRVDETTRTILFDLKMKHFVGIPAGFKEKKRNEDAMIYVAMAITPKQWKVLQTLDFNGREPRTEVFEIQKCTPSHQ